MKKVSNSNNKKKKKKVNNHGFTLVELLATFAILSLVLAIGIYFALDIVNDSRNKSYQVTINNIEKEAGSYVLENASSIRWISEGVGSGSFQYQCVTIQKLIDAGYFSGDVLKSEVDKGVYVNQNNYIYLERDVNNKTLTKNIFLFGDVANDYKLLCPMIDTDGYISFNVEPSGWSREKKVTIYYNLYNNVGSVSDYRYSYLLDGASSDVTKKFTNSSNQEIITLDKNGSIIAKIIDSGGNDVVEPKTLSIGKIDSINPSASIEDKNSSSVTVASSVQNIVITIKDNESGISSYYFGNKNPESENVEWISVGENKKEYSKEIEVNSDGKWYLGVRDNVGNQSIVSKEFYQTTLLIENGTVTPNKLITIQGRKALLPTPAMNSDYAFGGWYTSSNYSGNVITEYEATGNNTLYGRSLKKIGIPTNTYCKSGLEYTASEQTLTNVASEGYTFSGNKGTDAKEYEVKAILKEGYIWTDGSTGDKIFSCSIGKKPVQISASNQTITYGESITQGTSKITTSNLVSGHSLTSIKLTQSRTAAGTGTITASEAIIKSGSTDVTSNYSITYKTGVLTINKATCTCTIGSYTNNMEYAKSTSGNITYTCGGDGTINVTSGTTGVITVSNVGNVMANLTAKNVGTSKITVSRGEGNNYKACSAYKDVSVKASAYTFDLNWTLDGSNFTGTTDTKAGLKINGVDQGYVSDYYQQLAYGSTWEIYGIKLNGTNISYTASGTMGTADLKHAISINTLNIGVNNSNYGSVSSTSLYVKNGTTYSTSGATFTLSDGRKITATSKSVTGYLISFSGWSSTSGTISSSKTITANFSATPNSFTVDYNVCGGSGGPSSQTKTYDVNLTLSGTKPTKTGYTFKGWSITSCSGDVKYSAGGTYSDNKNVTMYAIWEDSVSPTCTLSVTTDAVKISTSDNVKVTEFGMSTSSTVTYNSQTSLALSVGTKYGFVKDAAGNTGSCSVKIENAPIVRNCSKSAISYSYHNCNASNFNNRASACSGSYQYASDDCSATYTQYRAICFYDEANRQYTWRSLQEKTLYNQSSCSATVVDGRTACTWDDWSNNLTAIYGCSIEKVEGTITCSSNTCDQGTLQNNKCYLWSQSTCPSGWNQDGAWYECGTGYSLVGDYCYK